MHINKIILIVALTFSSLWGMTKQFSLDNVDPKSIITLNYAIAGLPFYIPKQLLVGGDILLEDLKKTQLIFPETSSLPMREAIQLINNLRKKFDEERQEKIDAFSNHLKKYEASFDMTEKTLPIFLQLSEHPEMLFDKNYLRDNDISDKEFIKNKNNLYLSLEEMPKLLQDAKIIIKSFLPESDQEQESILSNPSEYIEKGGALERIFTYANLQREIKQKQLTQVHLPQKFLLIKDTKTGKFLSREEASKVIDNFIVLKLGYLNFVIDTAYEGFVEEFGPYNLKIFARKQPRVETGGLSPLAMDQLKILCQNVPFDIGYDNIFWDATGAAIIIDTERKHTQSEECGKLGRYPVSAPSK